MRGVKCTKCLYLNKHHGELRDPITEQQEAIFQQGTNVGELAQNLHPGGIDLTPESYYDFTPSVIATKEAIQRGENVIYEAAFLHDGVLAAMDILVKSDHGYKAYEVKSSTGVKSTYIQDAALQAYVIMASGVDLEDISIVHLNKTYKREGELDIQQLFTTVSIRDTIQPYLSTIQTQIDQFKGILNSAAIPNVPIGPHCSAPYSCDFTGHCWSDVPDYSVFDISGLGESRKFDLYNRGIVSLHQIPESENFSANQQKQIDAEVQEESYIHRDRIKEFLNDLAYPVHFLDFETMSFAVPQLEGSFPYEPIPFQYSMHKQHSKNALPEHVEFLAEPNGVDPRASFINHLLDHCGTTGTILVYNIGFEKRILNNLANAYPQHKTRIEAILLRMVDLMTPFKKKWYYTPEMKGSASLKYVYPAIFPTTENSYSGLNISDGAMASLVFAQMFQSNYNGNYHDASTDLLAYCQLDTLALVRLLDQLHEIVDHPQTE